MSYTLAVSILPPYCQTMMPNRETQGHPSLSLLLLSLFPASAGVFCWKPTRNQNSRVQ